MWAKFKDFAAGIRFAFVICSWICVMFFIRRPFTYTGVDFFGPFYVKRGRDSEKVYGCLFTCLTRRAVHIEDETSLGTDAFIQALRRFISNRGCPKGIWSDNGTNFVGADKEIRDSIRRWDQDDLNKQLINDEINCTLCPMFQWEFQPPAASRMNGRGLGKVNSKCS